MLTTFQWCRNGGWLPCLHHILRISVFTSGFGDVLTIRHAWGSDALQRSTGFTRFLMASILVAGAVALAGCETDDVSPGARAMRPLPAALVAEIESKNMPKESPILVRI